MKEGKCTNPQILNSEANMNNLANTKQIRLIRRSPSYWRVTFDHPPLNIFGPETIPELNEIVTALETDKDLTGSSNQITVKIERNLAGRR